MWAQQYLTLLSNHDFHSRGQSPCIKTGKPALPVTRELPPLYRPYATLFSYLACLKSYILTAFNDSPTELLSQLLLFSLPLVLKGPLLLLLTGNVSINYFSKPGNQFSPSILSPKAKRMNIVPLSIPLLEHLLLPNFARPTLEDLRYVLTKKLKSNTATGLDGWRPHEFKNLPHCLLLALLDVLDLCEKTGKFHSSFYYSYTTLIPKSFLRTPLSLRPITVLPVPYRVYASLRCQTLLLWQNSWIHSSQFAFCKGRSTISLNSTPSFDLLGRYQQYGSFAGIQFGFAKCFDSIPYSIIWETLLYYGCDPSLVSLLRHLYTHMSRCFRYAGCLGSFWTATNGLLQGDPLSVVILNCILCPLLDELSGLGDLTIYAFADDLTIVSSSWDVLSDAFNVIKLFCSTTDLQLNLTKCQLWNKGTPSGTYSSEFDQFSFCFYPFLLGSPIDIGVPYDHSLQTHDATVLTRAKKISKLPLPHHVAYRLFIALVSSCYNHFALSCEIRPSQSTSLKHAITSILVPKRSKWVCREALFSLITPGHLLSPQLFLNYRHIIEYLLYVKKATVPHRHYLSQLWHSTYHLRWGPFYRLRKAAKQFGFIFEDPFVLQLHDMAYSVDEPLDSLKHLIKDSYRRHYLFCASKRRKACQGQTMPIDVSLTRFFFLSQSNPLHQSILRYVLTGSLDHAQRLFKSNLTTDPLCPYCHASEETAKHIFLDCSRWHYIRLQYPILLRLFQLLGTQWPNCYLHCGWIEQAYNYGFDLLHGLDISYHLNTFVHDTHHMYLTILLARFNANQVLHTTPHAPTDLLSPPHSIVSSPSSCAQLLGDVSPISILSSPG